MNGMSGKVETERKFDVGPDFTVPGLAGLPQVASVTGPVTYLLDAVYFDTPDLRLFAARITLRRRAGGTDAGWHLKLPAGIDTRREVHAPLADEADGVPASLSTVVAAQTGGQPLGPIARLRTTRQVHLLLDDAGATLAEVADDRVSGSVPDPDGHQGSWAEVTTWREVEVELVTGSRHLLDDAGTQLCEAGARPSKAASKLGLVLTAANLVPGTSA